MRQDRRHFLWLVSCVSSTLALSLATGCTVNPISGKRKLVIIGEKRELAIDKQQAPRRFSQDLGVVQDSALNDYIADVGLLLFSNSPGYNLPFNFQVVNASGVNSYAFPAGSIAITRGMMLQLRSEDELAGLLGHEIAHVNARHPAEHISKSILVDYATFGLDKFLELKGERLDWVELLLSSAAEDGELLIHYSLENELEADALGMSYANDTGYNPQGIVSLMSSLRYRFNRDPTGLELLFATHPMSDQRFSAAQETAQKFYYSSLVRKLRVEEYHDRIASLRAIRASVEAQQQAEDRFAQKDIDGAIDLYNIALDLAPEDYPALIGAGRMHLIKGNSEEGKSYAKEAIRVYQTEAQGYNLLVVAHLQTGEPELALQALSDYDRLLPGNPNGEFLRGVSYDQMGDRDNAVESFEKFLETSKNSQQVEYAQQRLEIYDE